jgi:transposase
MRAFSNDLRERIVAAVERGQHTLRQLADLFMVDVSVIVRLRQRQRQTGSIEPKPHGGGRQPKLDEVAQTRLLELVRQHPDATLAELRQQLGVVCGLTTIHRALKRHGITRKKKTSHADERDSPEVQAKRAAFEAKMAEVDPAHLVFVDETGATTAMTRTHGRAPSGERVTASAPGSWENTTFLVGLRQSGVVAPFAFRGATDQLAFETYVDKVLVPILQPGDVVIWDNLKPHHSAAARAAVESVGATVQPLPPYSPDETPIEELFSKTKEFLRSIGARTSEILIDAMAVALDLVTETDIQGWFQHRCSYAMQ